MLDKGRLTIVGRGLLIVLHVLNLSMVSLVVLTLLGPLLSPDRPPPILRSTPQLPSLWSIAARDLFALVDVWAKSALVLAVMIWSQSRR